MQNAETVLDVLRERGRRGLPCDELYRQLFNPNLYLLAYGRIYANHGAMTPGACGETADGMSETKIGRITEAMRHERYRFRPVRRVHIPKSNGKTRPLGLPSWSDKLVGEVIRLLLEAYYEPQFSGRSHGFRPGRGCHTALSEVTHNWTGTTWFIEGDISDCFGSLDHEVLLAALSKKIRDNRFLRLIQQMLKAGYLEDWKWHATLSGSPQGGVLSPLLSNIYMDRLDTFVETVLIPEYTRGTTRRRNPEYQKLENAIWSTRQRLARRKEHTESAQVRQWRRELRHHPVGDPHDPGYRRLRYIRYADDHLLGFIGPKAEAETIKQRLAAFLRDDLKLELNQDKTLITHGRTQAARFLGYEITVQHADAKVSRGGRVSRGLRSINGKISLRVPKNVIKAKCAPFLRRGKPTHLDSLTGCTPFDIISLYGAQYRGIAQYYLLAGDVWKLDRLKGVMLTSLLKTLAAKHRSRVTAMANRYKTTIKTPQGPRRCFEARIEREGRKPLVARFGGIPLTRKRTAVLDDLPSTMFTPHSRPRGSQLIDRLQRGWCELCERRTDVQVHQVRSLAELRGPGEQPAWAQLMLKKRRRTLVVCLPCHRDVHA
ncbi:reverse transcriptase domain-containing protein [Streptomyces sp. B1866]|uniref:reverse transcriptase domain-containing protein n=1 Tax=Streptomyces sp. B1866 TaxID=3075431 RepID=UPI00288D84EB|nr:reverse transcriptase domain-containing protein [Streptomyces sp. B1866]MDT3396946.1 reverse transcriptase domain-containing protein [Streptomyces sp. B1866]